MAGKLGLAAKIFLGTTVLAGGGAGTWYATSNGLPTVPDLLQARAAGDADSKSPADAGTTELASADLDAVASAWDEPAEKQPATTLESSAVARSAAITTRDVEPPASETTAEPAATGSRYALAGTPTQAEQANSATAGVEPTEAASAEPTPAGASPVVAEDTAPRTTHNTEPQPVPAEAPDVATVGERSVTGTADSADDASPAALARGQEPADETELKALTSDPSAAEAQPATSARVDQARQAFQTGPPAATGGRYGAAAPNPNAAPADGGKTGLVNPFSTAAGAPKHAASADGNLQPLPRDNTPAELTELPPSNDLRPLRPVAPPTTALEPTAIGEPRNARSIASQRGTPGQSDTGAESVPPPSYGVGGSTAEQGADTPGEKALEGLQKPSLEIQKFAPAEIQVGKPAKFVVRVRNTGNQTAQDVSIQDAVPQGTKLVSTTPEAQNAGGRLVWDLGKLSSGEDRTVEMQLMPTTEGEIGSVATVHCSSQASVKTKCTMPQLAIRMTAPAKVMVGQEQRVKIELRNPGSGDATGVMLFENIPQNVKHAAGPALEFDIGTLKAGDTRELELVLMAEKPGKTVNVLSARGDGNLQVQQQVEFEVIAPGLTVGVEGPERRYLERPATYEVRVDNPGTAPAHDVQIVTKLPKGMRFIKANNRGEYDAASHAVYWSLAELPEGEHGVVELVAMPVEAGPQTLEVEGRAGQGLSDQTQRQIMIDGLAAIMFEVKDLEDPIEVGGETGYEIRVVNQGTKAATNVQVSVNLPPGMQLVSAEGETQHTEQRGAIVFEPLGQLAAKADTVYRIRVQGTAAGDQRVTVQVNTDDLGQPIRREESTLVYGDE